MTKELQGKLEWMHKEYVRTEREQADEEALAVEEAFKGWRYGFPSVDEFLNLQDLELEGIGFAPVSANEPF